LSLELNPAYFEALRTRARIFVRLELYEQATKDFTNALEHGVQIMSAFEHEELKIELEEAEMERNKGKDYYKILGLSMSSPLIKYVYYWFGIPQVSPHIVRKLKSERLTWFSRANTIQTR
jgi:hypothetical protein